MQGGVRYATDLAACLTHAVQYGRQTLNALRCLLLPRAVSLLGLFLLPTTGQGEWHVRAMVAQAHSLYTQVFWKLTVHEPEQICTRRGIRTTSVQYHCSTLLFKAARIVLYTQYRWASSSGALRFFPGCLTLSAQSSLACLLCPARRRGPWRSRRTSACGPRRAARTSPA